MIYPMNEKFITHHTHADQMHVVQRYVFDRVNLKVF